jgi:DnaJ-class molecular chaperone
MKMVIYNDVEVVYRPRREKADRAALIADLQPRVSCRTCGGDGGFNEQALYMCDTCDGEGTVPARAA